MDGGSAIISVGETSQPLQGANRRESLICAHKVWSCTVRGMCKRGKGSSLRLEASGINVLSKFTQYKQNAL